MAVLALFFLSGVASLILETVFRRELALLVGSAVTATSLTLATFLGGLALGASAFGRLADRTERPLRLYGLLELGVALTSALSLTLLGGWREWLLVPLRAMAGRSLAPVVDAALAAALVLPAAFLMGGTLPALARHAVRRGGRLLGPLATLYGVNTLGAALGAGLSGFVLFEAVGVSRTGWSGAALAASVGSLALTWDRATQRSADAAQPPPAAKRAARTTAPSNAPHRAAALLCAGLGGAAALGYEVVWTRLLVVPLRSYAYSFSLMLALFLVGLVLGAVIVGRLDARLQDPLRALAGVQLAGGAWVASSVLWMPALLAPAGEGSGFGAFLLNGILRAAPIVLPPTVLSGMALPLAARAYSASLDRAGADVGTVFAVNTAGSIAGALAAALVLLPLAGASHALALLAALGAAGGAVAAHGRARGLPFAWAVVAGCFGMALVPTGPYGAVYGRTGHGGHGAEATLFFREGATDTVSVVRRDYGFRDSDAKSMIVNGIAMTATVKPVWRYMAAEGHLPALFAPAPTRALVICVGTGITLGALASHADVTAIDAVDLSESVLAALPVFEHENDGAFGDPKVRLVHEDGRHFLELVDRPYGLITLEPPPPIVAGSVHLYTRDFYRLCRSRLEPGGVVAQWLPLHAQGLRSAQSTARTFLEEFSHVQLWLPTIRDAVLIGSDSPLTMDLARLRAAYETPSTRANLERAYFETPEALLGTFLLDREGVARWSAGGDVITDDRPWMEFFRRYGSTMSDREIGSLLEPPAGRFDWLTGTTAASDLLADLEAERRAHRLYLRSEIDGDAAASREAAVASRATRFGRYRLGCDAGQLEALRAQTAGGTAWSRQVDGCNRLFGDVR